jgi:hypothetical protein
MQPKPATTNEITMAGPANWAAATPVSVKMPVPIMAPIPSVTRLIGPSERRSVCSPVAVASAMIMLSGFLAKSWLAIRLPPRLVLPLPLVPACCPSITISPLLVYLSEQMTSIRITRSPPGIAPLAVREAWVGLVLPAVDTESDAGAAYWINNFRPPPRGSPWKLWDYVRWFASIRVMIGYAVPSLDALTVLEENRPEFATWWWEHAPTWWLLPTARLVFPKRCAEVVTTD